MSLKLQAMEQRLATLLAYHQKLVLENNNMKQLYRVERLIKRLLYVYEAGVAEEARKKGLTILSFWGRLKHETEDDYLGG